MIKTRCITIFIALTLSVSVYGARSYKDYIEIGDRFMTAWQKTTKNKKKKVYMKKGIYCYRKALTIDSKKDLGWARYMMALYFKGMYMIESKTALQRLASNLYKLAKDKTKEFPKSGWVHLWAISSANLYVKAYGKIKAFFAGIVKNIENWAKKLIKINPKQHFGIGYATLGRIYYEAPGYSRDKAVMYCRKAVSVKNNILNNFFLANALLSRNNRNDRREAKKILKMITKMKPSNFNRVYDLENIEKAKKMLKKL